MRTTVLTAALALTTALAAPTASAEPAGSFPPPAAPAGSRPHLGPCAAGELCLWSRPDFKGPRQVHDLTGLDIESCVPLPAGTTAQAVANRTGRPVTTYQSAECAETAEFETYPGGGTWVPQSPYRVRAFKVWEN
ncbi:peptidase inhibitor family I36 protein [Streptomyces sp. NPDC059176]|uniref:peptidase inhibitor family I36 protein n=1 Tax=unclassified Streptomyces TaxID=2593676 RepID=UPI0036AC3858